MQSYTRMSYHSSRMMNDDNDTSYTLNRHRLTISFFFVKHFNNRENKIFAYLTVVYIILYEYKGGLERKKKEEKSRAGKKTVVNRPHFFFQRLRVALIYGKNNMQMTIIFFIYQNL